MPSVVRPAPPRPAPPRAPLSLSLGGRGTGLRTQGHGGVWRLRSVLQGKKLPESPAGSLLCREPKPLASLLVLEDAD